MVRGDAAEGDLLVRVEPCGLDVSLPSSPKTTPPPSSAHSSRGAARPLRGSTVQLEAGFPARVRVVDERGAPVAGVRLKGGLVIEGGSCYSSAGWVTDDEGIATIPHASRRPYRLQHRRCRIPAILRRQRDARTGRRHEADHHSCAADPWRRRDERRRADRRRADQDLLRSRAVTELGTRWHRSPDGHHGLGRTFHARSARGREDVCVPDRDGHPRPLHRDGRRARPERPALGVSIANARSPARSGAISPPSTGAAASRSSGSARRLPFPISSVASTLRTSPGACPSSRRTAAARSASRACCRARRP